MADIEMFPQWLLDALRCPQTGAPLRVVRRDDGTQSLAAEGHPELEYDVVDGIPVLLVRAAD